MSSPEAKKQKVEDEGRMQVDSEAKADDLSGMKVQDLMQMYYGRLFPTQQMFKWLSYGNDSKHPQADAAFFQKREFCFTLDGDIFVRYQAFKDGDEMAAALRSRVPAKIDIGPVYSANPAERAKYSGAGQFVPVERELVFDIDLTDYDDVRTCGKEGHICGRCWPLMALAVNVIDAGLRQDFGFQHILWVYSGRRGIHCWVCDPAARRLTDEQRSAVASYFTVYKGHEKERAKLVGLGGSFKHPSLSRAEEALGGVWADVYLPAQRLLEDADMQAAMLRLLPDEDVAERVRGLWAGRLPRSGPNAPDASVQRWGQLADEVDRRAGAAKAEKNYKLERALRNAKAEIMFAFMYPRLDMEVSKKMNHLLKAPFCVHPKTGKVCVPIDPAAAWDFDPDAVPTIHQLCSQLSKLPAPASDDWRRTDMAACVDLFQSAFLDGLQAAGRGELAGKSRDALAASAARGDVSW